MKILLIGLGGSLGAILRYLVSGGVQGWSGSGAFPYGTLSVNLLGCLVIGLLSQLVELRGLFSPDARAFLFIGTLGAFTTFSTFGNETMQLMREGELFLSLANICAQILLGLTAVWLGHACAQWLWR